MPPSKLSIETLSGFGAFTRVITRGKRYEKDPIKAFVYYSSTKGIKVNVGFAVTKRIRKAVERNRLKRFMREAFRFNKHKLISHFDPESLVEIVFMFNGDPKLAPSSVRFKTVEQALSSLCSVIEVIDKK